MKSRSFSASKLSANLLYFFAASVCVVLILFLRKPQAFLLPQFWAEDATVFFRENLVCGPAAFIKTYAGYFHLLPRLISWAGGFLPYEAAPLFYNLAALSVFLLIAGNFLTGRIEHLQVLGLVAVSVLVPHDGECFVNLTNLQWMIGPYLLLYNFQKPAESKAQEVADSAGVLMIGLTGPFVLFCLPVFVWRAFQNRKFSCETAAAFLAAAIQGVALFLQLKSGHSAPLNWQDLGHVLFARFTGIWFGSFSGVFPAFQMAFALALIIFMATLLLKGGNRFFYGAAAVYAIAELSAALIKNNSILSFLAIPGNGERYFYFAYVMIGWIAVVALSEKARGFKYGAALILTLLFISSMTGFRAAAVPDLNWRANAARLRSDERFTIQINPQGWGLAVDKKRLDGNWLDAIQPKMISRK